MSNWLQDVINEVGALEDMLEDCKKNHGKGWNHRVNEEHTNALNAVAVAKEAISRLAAEFNRQHAADGT